MKTDETVRVFLGSHVTTQDALAIAEQVAWCDVYVPELPGWNEATVTAYNMVASGRMTLSALLAVARDSFDDFSIAQLALIAGTGKLVAFADVPDGHPVADDLEQLAELLKLIPSTRAPREEAIETLTLTFEHFAQANIKREAHIVERLCELVREHPGRRILVRLGAAHTPVVRDLRSRGIAVRAVFQQSRRRFDPDTVAYRYARFGRPIPPSVIAQCLELPVDDQ